MRGTFWNDERDAVLRRLREEGVENRNIAERMGCSFASVKARVRDLGLPYRYTPPAFFTPDRDARLTQLWGEGVSLKAIREAFNDGVSLAAISHRAQSLGLESRFRKGLNGYLPPKPLPADKPARPERPKPRLVYERVSGCTFIDPHGDGSRCGKGREQTCSEHRERVAPLSRGALGYVPTHSRIPVGLTGGRKGHRWR